MCGLCVQSGELLEAQALPSLRSVIRGLSPQSSCGYSGLLSDVPLFPTPCFSPSAESSRMGEGQASYISLWLGPRETRLESRCLAPPSPPPVKISRWSAALGWPSMEAATALEAASGSTLKVKETSPADAEGPPASSQQESGSPIPQLLPLIEGDLGGWEG